MVHGCANALRHRHGEVPAVRHFTVNNSTVTMPLLFAAASGQIGVSGVFYPAELLVRAGGRLGAGLCGIGHDGQRRRFCVTQVKARGRDASLSGPQNPLSTHSRDLGVARPNFWRKTTSGCWRGTCPLRSRCRSRLPKIAGATITFPA